MHVTNQSTTKTYRYLRVSLVGLVALLVVGIIVQWADSGLVGSISAAYYTPIQNVFVGSFVAIGVVLIAITGRRPFEDLLLNLAGMLAPVIAFVPTSVNDGVPVGVGELVVQCPPDVARCVPAEFVPGIVSSMQSLLWVAVLGVALAVVFAVIDGSVRTRAVQGGLAAAGVLVAAFAAWFVFGRESFIGGAHFAAAGGFLALIAAIAVYNAVILRQDRPAVMGLSREAYGRWYLVIAALLVLVLVPTGILLLIENVQHVDLSQQWGFPWFFLAEAAAMLLFATFWTLQTVEKWKDGDG